MTSYKTDDLNWTYAQDFRWNQISPDCAGTEQSPINIDTQGDNIKQCSVMCEMTPHFHPGNCRINFNKHNEIILDYKPKVNKAGKATKISSIMFNGSNHMVAAVRIFCPSMHRIDGRQFDMEIMIQCDSGISPEMGNLQSGARGVLLCKLLNKSENEYGNEETFINEFIHKIPGFSSDNFVNVPVSANWGIHNILPVNDSFFMYDGSLPRPPCSEKYTIIVYEEIGNIGLTNYNLLKKYVVNNSRTIQPIGTRTVFYSTGSRVMKQQLDQRDTELDDRFLQCVPSQDPVYADEEEEEDDTPIDNMPFSIKFARKIKNYFLLLFITLIFILSYFVILYLHKTQNFQRSLFIFLTAEQVKLATNKWMTCSHTNGSK
jgi:carbonic anhydrase